MRGAQKGGAKDRGGGTRLSGAPGQFSTAVRLRAQLPNEVLRMLDRMMRSPYF